MIPRSWAILALLVLAAILSMMDRMILGLLVTPIKADLRISDTEISLLQGLAFVVLYSVAGIPLGRAIDRGPRLKILAIGLAAWSIATSLSGLAGRVATLFVARAGVGIGEATLQPAAYSLIPDLFPAKRLGLAVGIFSTGLNLGTSIALLAGGFLFELLTANGAVSVPLLGTLEPWQQTFVIVGAPGLLVALVIGLIPEPERRAALASEPPRSDVVGWWKAEKGWLLAHHFGIACAAAIQYGSFAWITAFYQRTHGWSIGEASALAGSINLFLGPLALIGGGLLSDRLARDNPNARMYLCGSMMLAAILPAIAYPLLASPILAGALWGLVIMASLVSIGSAGAYLQQMTPAGVRGTASAAYFLIVNLFGMIVGPTSVALLSDHLFTAQDGVRFSLSITGAVLAAAGGVLLLATVVMRKKAAESPR